MPTLQQHAELPGDLHVRDVERLPAVELHGRGPHRLHSVTFPQALVLPEAESGREVQLVFDNDGPESGFALYSLEPHTQSWVNHMTGSLSVRPDDAPDATMEHGAVSCHNIAAIWVAFFSRWQRCRC